MDKWLSKANETLESCFGIGTEAETKQKLEAVTVSRTSNDFTRFCQAQQFVFVLFLSHYSTQSLSNRIPEGKHLLGMVQDAFTKATNVTPEDRQDDLRENMSTLRESWEHFTMNVQEILDVLKSALNRFDEFNDAKQRFERWLTETEQTLQAMPDTKGELSEMKTMLERFKHLQEQITAKHNDLDHLTGEAKELSSWSRAATQMEEISKLEARWEKLDAECKRRIQIVESEMSQYNSYHQKLQEAEKWLLQVSFQLMAHNSLYITNREQTQEQINQHEILLDDIQKYQHNLDDLRAKGNVQIERYEQYSPTIRGTIETQLKNIQDSYNSLLNTSIQIRNRLHESLAKFQEYENTIDSIMNNLENYEPIIVTELDEPATDLAMAQKQLKLAQSLHTKLQGEKSRLAVAVQACEAATASISRPSSPLETAMQPIPEKELMVRAKLEDLIDQVRHCAFILLTFCGGCTFRFLFLFGLFVCYFLCPFFV